MFTLKEILTNKTKKFSIINHTISENMLDESVCEFILDIENLKYIFDPFSSGIKNENNLLNNFIERNALNNEKYYLDNKLELENIIKENMKSKSYFSFLAEGLLAIISKKVLKENISSAVITTSNTLIDQHTGTDTCLYTEEQIILGEAKFYLSLNDGIDQIIEDIKASSFLNKIDNLFRSTTNLDDSIIIKNIHSKKIQALTFEEFKQLGISVRGFVLHNKLIKEDYSNTYSKINQNILSNYIVLNDIHFFHLPIKSKKDLILKIQLKAMEIKIYGRSKQ